MSLLLTSGIDGETLEVALPRRGSGDGESEQLSIEPSPTGEAAPSVVSGCRSSDVDEVLDIVRPRRAEGEAVDARCGAVVASAQGGGAGGGSGGVGTIEQWRDVVKVSLQQGKGVDDLEACSAEHRRGVREEGAGADGVHGDGVGRRVREVMDPAGELVGRRNDRLVGEQQLHGARLIAPRPHTYPPCLGPAHDRLSNLHRKPTVVPRSSTGPATLDARRRRKRCLASHAVWWHAVPVLFATHASYLEHNTGPGHPERPSRLQAVVAGSKAEQLTEVIAPLEPREATRAELERVHPAWFLERLDELASTGGGWIDADTRLGVDSVQAAARAAGAGLTAVEALRRGDGSAAFCAVRPPGHHATRTDAMGFCLVSNLAVVAAALAADGERVWVLDYDAHHGNGTQDVFYDDPGVLFVSLHQWPLYPGTGRSTDTGAGAGAGSTLNVPLPAGATGDVYLTAFDELVAPVVEQFAPSWLLISAGFDAHRDDPLTDLGLTAGDFSMLTRRALELVPPGRCVAMLEGGYDLEALAASTTAVIGALAGEDLHPEPPTSGGPGLDAVARVRGLWMPG